MKKKIPSLILILALLSALWILSACSQQASSAFPLYGAAALRAQVVTPTPPLEDHSEIGSTSGILVMGIAITALAILPVLIYGKRK